MWLAARCNRQARVGMTCGWNYLLPIMLLVGCVLFLSGCTTALWEHDRFAHYRYPAVPNHLQLGYSAERKDVLVQYKEAREEDDLIRNRTYWLEPNCARIGAGHKPKYVSAKEIPNLTPIPITNEVMLTRLTTELHAVVSYDSFTLYSGNQELNVYKLPVYAAASQRVKQVLLTPFAALIDATIIGAVIASHVHWSSS